MRSLLRFAAFGIGLSSIGADIQGPHGLYISGASVKDQYLQIEVTNTGSEHTATKVEAQKTADEIQIGGHAKAVASFDLQLDATCNLPAPTTYSYTLTPGPNVDSRARTVLVKKAVDVAAFKVAGSVTKIAPALEPLHPDVGRVSMVGGPAATYACGSQFRTHVTIKNDTTVTPQHLVLVMKDPNGTKIGEAPVNVAAKSQADVPIQSSANVSGRPGAIRFELVDSTGELNAKLNIAWTYIVEVTRTTPGPTATLTN